MENDNQSKSLENSFLNSDFVDTAYSNPGEEIKDYVTSSYKEELYKLLTEQDLSFNQYIKAVYGSQENYFAFNNSLNKSRIYDPESDYFADIVIKTKEHAYKSEFISFNEVIMELLSGVCTIDFSRVNGNSDKIVGTLSEDLIPDSQNNTRIYGFGGLGGGRILVWDIVKGGWSSFYMSNLIRFVRDETSGIE
jgi:hypothetical protein